MDSCVVWHCPEPRLGKQLWCFFHTYVDMFPLDGKLRRKVDKL